MTPEQILELAEEAEFDKHRYWNDDGSNRLVTFAKLIEAHTREECAKVCRHLIANKGTSASIKAAKEVASLCAEAIEGMK